MFAQACKDVESFKAIPRYQRFNGPHYLCEDPSMVIKLLERGETFDREFARVVWLVVVAWERKDLLQMMCASPKRFHAKLANEYYPFQCSLEFAIKYNDLEVVQSLVSFLSENKRVRLILALEEMNVLERKSYLDIPNGL
jgi:hypothetical protein